MRAIREESSERASPMLSEEDVSVWNRLRGTAHLR
jgi:hypothetical protein